MVIFRLQMHIFSLQMEFYPCFDRFCPTAYFIYLQYSFSFYRLPFCRRHWGNLAIEIGMSIGMSPRFVV